MSRLCRLKTASHGEDGKWAYQEIVNLREENAKQAEQIKLLKIALNIAADKFHDYAEWHSMKEATPENREKVERNLALAKLCDEALSDTPPVQDSHHCDTCANNGNTRGVCQNAACNWEPRVQDRRSER